MSAMRIDGEWQWPPNVVTKPSTSAEKADSPPQPCPWKGAKFKPKCRRETTIKTVFSFPESMATTMTTIAGVRQRVDERMSPKMCKKS